jgi:NMD protein affecting ribosome stability and mRNA decay
MGNFMETMNTLGCSECGGPVQDLTLMRMCDDCIVGEYPESLEQANSELPIKK